VYLAAGLLSSAITLAAFPVAVNVGASGAIFGAYGLMLAVLLWGVLRKASWIIPVTVAKRLAPAAAMFVLYNLATDTVASVTEFSGFITGFACGLVVAANIGERKASVRRVAVATVATIAAAVATAAPLRGIADVVPELERVVAVEKQTAATFRAASDRFNNGRISARALAEVIERAIIPELAAARARFESIGKVPEEQRTLVAACSRYLRLRDESWRIRSAGFRDASMSKLREADTVERSSLEILREFTPADRS
jgi:hypothetical protein